MTVSELFHRWEFWLLFAIPIPGLVYAIHTDRRLSRLNSFPKSLEEERERRKEHLRNVRPLPRCGCDDHDVENPHGEKSDSR